MLVNYVTRLAGQAAVVHHDGFVIETYEDENGREVWIYRDGMTRKQFMFGFTRENPHFDRFYELVEENLDDYERNYRYDYMR